jgi:hypothetical protein
MLLGKSVFPKDFMGRRLLHFSAIGLGRPYTCNICRHGGVYLTRNATVLLIVSRGVLFSFVKQKGRQQASQA